MNAKRIGLLLCTLLIGTNSYALTHATGAYKCPNTQNGDAVNVVWELNAANNPEDPDRLKVIVGDKKVINLARPSDKRDRIIVDDQSVASKVIQVALDGVVVYFVGEYLFEYVALNAVNLTRTLISESSLASFEAANKVKQAIGISAGIGAMVVSAKLADKVFQNILSSSHEVLTELCPIIDHNNEIVNNKVGNFTVVND